MRCLSLLSVLSLLSSCRCDDEHIIQARPNCGKPCVETPSNIALTNVGDCQTGTIVCSPDGGEQCSNYVLPSLEECDGRDNNCDGLADNVADSPKLCSSACESGLQYCRGGQWTQCSARVPQMETCNAVDDDCDGVVDNNLAVMPCFDGRPPASPLYGICHGGTLRCAGGIQTCFGQQLPFTEQCNGIDDDCDGTIDDGVATRHSIDFVFIFDNSGSMYDVAASLKSALSTWTAKYSSFSERRYALVAAPHNDAIAYPCMPRLIQNFTDATGIANAVNTQSGVTGSGLEPTLNALMDTLDVTGNPYGLNWSSAANKKVILIFSDEHPQGYAGAVGCNEVTPAMSMQAVATLNVQTSFKLHVFTRAAYGSFPVWQPIAVAGRGHLYEVAVDAMTLEASLDDVIQELVCQ